MKKVLIFFFILAIILAPIAVVEAGFLDRIVPQCNENLAGNNFTDRCTICHIVQLIQNILSFLITVSVIIATLMFVYAGFLYLTAGGSADKIKSATKIFTNVFIGFIFVLGAFLIVDTIMKTFYNQSKFGPWNEIDCGSSSSSGSNKTAPKSKSSLKTVNTRSAGSSSDGFIKYDKKDIRTGFDAERGYSYKVVGEDKDGKEVRFYPDLQNDPYPEYTIQKQDNTKQQDSQ